MSSAVELVSEATPTTPPRWTDCGRGMSSVYRHRSQKWRRFGICPDCKRVERERRRQQRHRAAAQRIAGSDSPETEEYVLALWGLARSNRLTDDEREVAQTAQRVINQVRRRAAAEHERLKNELDQSRTEQAILAADLVEVSAKLGVTQSRLKQSLEVAGQLIRSRKAVSAELERLKAPSEADG